MKQFIICPNCGAIELHESSMLVITCLNCGEIFSKLDGYNYAKAISIKQPWAYLICSGIKDIENRTWKTNFRGRVLIHAGVRIDKEAFMKHWSTIFPRETASAASQLNGSTIIGSVEIVDCVINHESVWAENGVIGWNWKTTKDGFIEEVEKPVYNWVLANPIIFEKPILNVKGKLSFFIPEIL